MTDQRAEDISLALVSTAAFICQRVLSFLPLINVVGKVGANGMIKGKGQFNFAILSDLHTVIVIISHYCPCSDNATAWPARSQVSGGLTDCWRDDPINIFLVVHFFNDEYESHLEILMRTTTEEDEQNRSGCPRSRRARKRRLSGTQGERQ